MRSKTEVVWSTAIREAIEPVASWFDVDGEDGEPMEMIEVVKQIASMLAEERQHSLAMLAALQKFVAWHDMDHETMTGVEVQKAYDQAIDAAKSALRKIM